MIEITASKDAFSDVISYSDRKDSLGSLTDTEDECEPMPSRSMEHPKPPSENKMMVNQGNYSNLYQMDNFVMVKYGAQQYQERSGKIIFSDSKTKNYVYRQ